MARLTVKPTLFVTTIQGQDYQFAALSQKDMERLAVKEAAAVDAKDEAGVRAARKEIVSVALTRGGTEATVDDVSEMDQPLFSALFFAVLEAHGVKLEAKVGEAQASSNS